MTKGGLRYLRTLGHHLWFTSYYSTDGDDLKNHLDLDRPIYNLAEALLASSKGDSKLSSIPTEGKLELLRNFFLPYDVIPYPLPPSDYEREKVFIEYHEKLRRNQILFSQLPGVIDDYVEWYDGKSFDDLRDLNEEGYFEYHVHNLWRSLQDSITKISQRLKSYPGLLRQIEQKFPGHYANSVLKRLFAEGVGFLEHDPWFQLQGEYWDAYWKLVLRRHNKTSLASPEEIQILERNLAILRERVTQMDFQNLPPQTYPVKLLPPESLSYLISKLARSGEVELRFEWRTQPHLPNVILLRKEVPWWESHWPKRVSFLPDRHRQAIAWLISRDQWPPPGSVTRIFFDRSDHPINAHILREAILRELSAALHIQPLGSSTVLTIAASLESAL